MGLNRENTARRQALLIWAIQAGIVNPRERPDQYFLLALWTPEDHTAGLDPLEVFLAELDPELRNWIQEALKSKSFCERWKTRFDGDPTVEGFWLYLAKEAICRRAKGCLLEFCRKDALDFAKALSDLAPENGWLSLRRKRGIRLEDPCRKAILAALREVWADELARKLKEELALRTDEKLAKEFAALDAPFPFRLLAAPPWGQVAVDWLDATTAEVARCPQAEERAHVLWPPLLQLFDEITAPQLAKRRGCRTTRPGTPLFAAGARNQWPELYEVMVGELEAWLRAHPTLVDQKRFYRTGDPAKIVFDLYSTWLARFSGGTA